MSTPTSSSLMCLICSCNCSPKTAVNIFNKEGKITSETPLSLSISKFLNREVNEENTTSDIVCKKCCKLVEEADELEQRLLQIRTEISTNYLNANIKQSKDEADEGASEQENKPNEIEIDTKPIEDSNKENEFPKKILDIPSSDDDNDDDDDTTQHQESGDDKAAATAAHLQTIEDIEMELVKMHGGIENVVETRKMNSSNDDVEMMDANSSSSQSFHEFNTSTAGDIIIEAATDDHSSDSDYEPTNVQIRSSNHRHHSFVTTTTSTLTINKSEEIKIKLEPSSNNDQSSSSSSTEKPNILKKKQQQQVNEFKIKDEPIINNLHDHHQEALVSRQESLFTCLLCQTTTGENDETTIAGDVRLITNHMKMIHDIRLYICDVCGQEFRKRNELSAHLDEHVAAEEGDFQCEVCNRIFSNLRLFRIHRRMHYPQNKAWPCNTCGKKYSSKNLLEEHLNTHTGVRPYICGACGKAFASKYTFKAHEKTHEVRPRPFRCSQCSKSFLSHQNLVQHEKTHLGLKEFSCHLCGKQFGSAHNLEVHSIVHTGYKPFVCTICNKAFARKAEIRDHERTHTGERPYQCELCGSTFSQRSNLQSHKRATHLDDKRYICMDCGKGFKRRRLLDYHVKAAHTGERPYKCSICDATFVYPEHFKKHRRIHTGEKPYSCEVCGKAFNSRDNRNAHRFVHSDKKPYECLVCGAGFMRKPLLYQHMQSQGHLNDTIVVNQPRLTTDDEQLVTVNSRGIVELVEPVNLGDTTTTAIENNSISEDSKLYISEHILTAGSDQDQDQGDADDGGGNAIETVEHIIIDGQHLRFQSEDEEIDMVGETLGEGETQIIETPDGPVQLVRVRIPNENGEEEEAWIKIVPE